MPGLSFVFAWHTEHTDAALASGVADGGCSEQSAGTEACDRSSKRQIGKGGSVGCVIALEAL